MSKPKYLNKKEICYHSFRYGKCVVVPEGYPSDGATFAADIYSDGWWIHDKLCDSGMFEDGTPCTNWQASQILSDVLADEGRWMRKHYWKWATFLLGGGKARENGMLHLKESSK